MNKAAIYARSTESDSLQERVCRQYAETNGYEVIRVYSDFGHCKENAAFQTLLKDSETAEWSAVIFYSPDRIVRNPHKFFDYRRLLKARGIRMLCVTAEKSDEEEFFDFLDAFYNKYLKRSKNRK